MIRNIFKSEIRSVVNGDKKGMSLLKMILLIALIVLILSYIGFDIRSAIESDQSKKNFGYIKAVTVTIWERYLQRPAKYLWNDIFIDLIWDTGIGELKNLKSGKPMEMQKDAPKV